MILQNQKKASLEEQSKQFLDENLEVKTIADFTNKLLNVKDEKLVDMIILGHKTDNNLKMILIFLVEKQRPLE